MIVIFVILVVIFGTLLFLMVTDAKANTERRYRNKERIEAIEYQRKQQANLLTNNNNTQKTIFMRPEQEVRVIPRQVTGTTYDGERNDWWV